MECTEAWLIENMSLQDRATLQVLQERVRSRIKAQIGIGDK